MSKKIILILLFIFFVFTSIAFAEQAEDLLFPDVEEGSFYEEAVKNMSDLGVIKGYNDGNFKPNNPITRGEMATILDRYDKIIEESGCTEELELINDELKRIEGFYKAFEENPATPPPEI